MTDAEKNTMDLSISTPEAAAALLADRCYRDEDFRQKLLADPRACLEELSGRSLPPGVELQVVENGEDVWHLSLPDSTFVAQELSDDQLEQAAAGEIAASVAITIAAISISAIAVGVLSAGVAVGAAALSKSQ